VYEKNVGFFLAFLLLKIYEMVFLMTLSLQNHALV